MTANYGAHEVMEVHEVLTDTIDGINQFNLYRPHVKDPQLSSIIDRHIQFMTQQYNNMVQAINQRGMFQTAPNFKTRNISPGYGLNNPESRSPESSINQINDRDVASGMLGCHKASAILRMMATLECADPNLRRMLQQGAIDCSEQAYEVWQYMNQKGYYQVPTMKDNTTSTVLNSYTTTSANFQSPANVTTGIMSGANPARNPGQITSPYGV